MNARQKAELLFPHNPQRDLAGNAYNATLRDGFTVGALYATSPDNVEAVEAMTRAMAKTDSDWLGATYEELAKAALTALHELMKGENGD